jgi:hypothetical protein
MKRREKSDLVIVPESVRKDVLTAATQGGKDQTVREVERQLEIFPATAESLPRSNARAVRDQSRTARSAQPKAGRKDKRAVPAMTMEEVASEGNRKRRRRGVLFEVRESW